MEDKNRNELKDDDFVKAYKKEILANENISYFVRQLVENDCINLKEKYYYYCVSDVIRVFELLDNYLKYNVDNLEAYELSSKFYLDAEKYCEKGDPINSYYYWNHPVIQICNFESCLGNSGYNMYTDGYPGELHYVLKDSIKMQDAVKNEGILSIHVKPAGDEKNRDTLKIEKDYINNGLFVEETYIENKMEAYVEISVYDFNHALAKQKCDPYYGTPAEDIKIKPYPYKRDRDGIMGARKPWYVNRKDMIFCGMIIYNKKENVYELSYYDKDGYHSEKLNGESLYSVYYNYMVEKGFINQSNEKAREK